MATQIEHGYLVLADISGYTSYLAQVELEHAHEILTGLLEVIVDQFKTMLTISKLEGDAVFANVNETRVPRPEALLEMIENTYLAFRTRRDSAQRQTTCTCQACKNIQSLELKFFVHQGGYIVQNIAGIRELVGSDINLIHRLMKNHVTQETGWKAYLMFTAHALGSMQLKSMDGLHEQVEAYEHLGEVQTLSLDLQKQYDSLLAARRIVISPEESDLTLSCELNAPVSLVWQLITDPSMLTKTMREDGSWSIVGRPGGRSGVGAQNHCAHGQGSGMDYTYLDWRPFQYYTAEAREGKMSHWEMFQVESAGDVERTQFTVRIKMLVPFPRPIKRLMVSWMARKAFLEFFERIRKLLDEMGQPELMPGG